MMQLLKYDFYKLSKNTSYKICLLITVLGAIFSTTIFYFGLKLISGELLEAAGGSATDLMAFDAITMLDYGTISMSAVQFISILAAIVITNMMTHEIGSGTLRVIASKSFQRSHIYFSKLITAWFVQLTLFLGYLIPSMIVSSLLWKNAIHWADYIGFFNVLIVEVLLYMGIASLFVMVAMLLKNTGSSMAVNVCVVLIPSVLLTVLDNIVFQDVVLRYVWVFSGVEQFADMGITISATIGALAVGIAYICVPACIGVCVFKKQDIR